MTESAPAQKPQEKLVAESACLIAAHKISFAACHRTLEPCLKKSNNSTAGAAVNIPIRLRR
jgi:hypothetical protein